MSDSDCEKKAKKKRTERERVVEGETMAETETETNPGSEIEEVSETRMFIYFRVKLHLFHPIVRIDRSKFIYHLNFLWLHFPLLCLHVCHLPKSIQTLATSSHTRISVIGKVR